MKKRTAMTRIMTTTANSIQFVAVIFASPQAQTNHGTALGFGAVTGFPKWNVWLVHG